MGKRSQTEESEKKKQGFARLFNAVRVLVIYNYEQK